MIIARNKEMNKIYELANSKNFEFLVMYGRRRVGKTELLKELSRNKKTIFYAAQEKNDKLNLDEFVKVLKVYFNENNDFVFDNWKSAFEYFVEKVSNRVNGHRSILISIDPDIESSKMLPLINFISSAIRMNMTVTHN